MILSLIILKVKYLAVHYIGAVIALLGVGCMIAADILTGKYNSGITLLLFILLSPGTAYTSQHVWDCTFFFHAPGEFRADQEARGEDANLVNVARRDSRKTFQESP